MEEFHRAVGLGIVGKHQHGTQDRQYDWSCVGDYQRGLQKAWMVITCKHHQERILGTQPQ